MKKALSILLCIAMLLCLAPLSLAQEKTASGSLLLATLSDIHYYPASLARYKSEAFYTYMKGANAVYEDMDGIIDSAFAALEKDAREKGLKYVVITGDLTTNGEYEGHAALAEKLHKFEEESGLSVYLMNGNHDINNSNASDFTTPDLNKNAAKTTTPSEFYELYKDFGYLDADAAFADDIEAAAAKGIPGALSYAVSVDGGYRLIMIDAGKYSAGNTKSGKDEHETGGNITQELLNWIIAQAKEAQKNGETPIAFTHWNLSEMNYMHGEVLQGFVIDNAYKLQETFADAGIHYVFSGHQHVSDLDVTYSDSGEPLYSCITPTLTQYPFQFRETAFTRGANGAVTAEYKQYPCDIAKKVKSLSGTEFTQPYHITTGCAKQLGDELDASVYLLNMIKNLLSGYISDIQTSGSIVTFIKEQFGFDLEGFLRGYIKDGIVLGGDELFTMKNVMSFINDLDNQLYSKFIENPDELLWPSVQTALKGLLSVRISDIPCTKYIDVYGFGSKDSGGTISDLFFTVLVNMYPGNENASDDPFIRDVLENCGKPEFVDLIFDAAIKYVVDGFALDVILGNAEVRFDALFDDGSGSSTYGYLRLAYQLLASIISSKIYKPTSVYDFISKLGKVTTLMSTGEAASYKLLIEAVLSTGYISYGTSVNDIVYMLLDKYLGDIEKQAAAYQIYVIADGIFNDPDRDWDVTYTYSGAEKITPTVEDMQLPNNANLSLGSDASTSFNIKWMTKYSVTGTDIEIVKAGERFTGKATKTGVSSETEYTTISCYGFDFGTFGILPWTREVNIHTVTVTGLKPGTDYKFRIGDFKKGFVSEGTVTTADNDGRFTFAFLSDNAGVTPDMYDNFNAAVRTAANKNDLGFIIHGGNSVYNGDNEDQWGWSLNGARDTLLNVPVQYVSGAGDIGNTAPVTRHYKLTAVPPYSETLRGAFYSFDYENTHFTVVNTNETDADGSLSAGQLQWIANDLEGTDAQLKILVLNAPLFGVNTAAPGTKAMLVTLINRYNVNLVLGGSDTVYSRTAITDGGTALAEPDTIITNINGKVYEAYINVPGFISVSGCSVGSAFDDALPEGSLYKKTAAANAPVYTVINIDGEALGVDAYKLNPDGTTTRIDSFAVTTHYSLALMGDVDMNDSVSAADARLALRASVDLETLTPEQLLRADVDGNGRVSSADARMILRAAVNLEQITPKLVKYTEEDLKKMHNS